LRRVGFQRIKIRIARDEDNATAVSLNELPSTETRMRIKQLVEQQPAASQHSRHTVHGPGGAGWP